eukprot:gnl/TRDRNA2_/TRDRNA2_93036_c0_seq1.p1 gnl/TRDRNA2_/TRDRNA2_93036_c0~~gnl/TRDRNA2_/TRDRNA2_93036_c0_seq1.p1  ORF type:complete len:186 (+),score=34.59 gnl/TRDRNA2_/TRDRNA2_93036_c0_seq1:96-653(+)
MPAMSVLLCLALVVVAATFDVAPKPLTDKEYMERIPKEPGVMPFGPEAPGMFYKVIREGTGEQHPKEDTPCECHYIGTTVNGTLFDCTHAPEGSGETATFAPNQVITGWSLALQKMVEGDKWMLYIPPELGYGAAGRPKEQGACPDRQGLQAIPPNTVTIFTLELVKIKGDTVPVQYPVPTILFS